MIRTWSRLVRVSPELPRLGHSAGHYLCAGPYVLEGKSRRLPEHAATRALAVLVFLLSLYGCGGTPVTSPPVSNPVGTLTAPAGQTFQSGAPATVILSSSVARPSASSVTISLQPVSGGTGYTSLPVTAVGDGGNGTSTLTFTIPALTITAPAQFVITAAGGSGSSAFTTSPGLQVTIQPGALISALTPTSATAGATLDVTITGSATTWVSGTTTASFGAGISVGGGAVGAAGPVQVTSATSATAHLVIAANAVTGTRDVVVTTGTQVVTLTAGFAIKAAPLPPTASAGGPYTATTGQPVTLSAAASTDPAGLALTYSWTFGDGGTGTGVSPAHTYSAAAKFTATVTVTNSAGASATANAVVTVSDAALPPVASAGGPYTGTAGTAVNFSAAGSTDPKGEALTFAWTFGDGGTASGVSPTHTYATAGTYTVTLKATNTDNLSATSTTTASIATAQQPPIANAGGPYTGTVNTPVAFSASGSTDPKGEALSYTWNFGDNTTGSGATTTHTYTAAGTYTATVKVANTDNLSSSASATVTIAAAPQPPIANAGGPYTGTAGTAVTFNGASSTDPKGETLTYIWNFGDSTSGSGANPDHTYAQAGTYTVTLKLTNTDNLNASATTTATIAAAPQPPTAIVGGPYTGTAGTAVTFNATASSDPKGETLTYVWNFGDNTTGSGATTTHTYAAAGTYTVTLKVTNTDNQSATATITATIAAAKQSPAANAGGSYSGTANTAISFNGSGSTDPKNETLTYAWDFGDKSTGTGANPTHAYAAGGTYTVTLTVSNTDNLSATATTTATIAAAPQPPIADAGGPYTGTAGTAVTFSGAASTDPKNETLTYSWSFADNSTGTGANPTHTYASNGIYTVSLTVTNTDNLTATASTTATIAAAPQAPVANSGGPYTGTAGTAITFNGAGSSDPKNEVLTYAWTFGDGTTGTGVSPSHTYAASGTFSVSLTVTNTDNLSATSSTTATIAAAAQPPVANAGGPYSGTAGTAVSFNGSASTDPQGENLTYTWAFGDGTSGAGVDPTHTYAASGTYVVTLTVVNTDHLSAMASTTAVIASSASQVPIANAGGPYTGTVNVGLSFDGTNSYDPANQSARSFALTFMWNFGDGTSGVGASPVHAYAQAGTYNVSLTVQTATGLTATATSTAVISASTSQGSTPKPLPGGPYTGTTSSAVSFSGTGSSDPNNATLSYHWVFGDGFSADGATVSHTYGTAGTFSVELSVFNGTNSNSATTTATITAAAAPVLVVNAGGPYMVSVNQPLVVDGTQTNNPGNHQQTFTWNFGDGGSAAGSHASHVYTTQGSFTLTLTASDSSGLSGSATTTVTVGPPPAEAVTASAGGPYTDVTGHSVTFDASGSSDNLSNPLTYTWNFGDGATGTGINATHAYTTKGTFTATVTATGATASAQASSTVIITNALQVTITSPTANALFGTTTTTVSGTLSAPNFAVIVNNIAAQVSGTSFTASGVSLREGVNLISAMASDGAGGVGTGTVSVIMDATAPTISITSPADGTTVTTSTIAVAGLVNDIVTGTVGSNDVTVTVNGLAAQVSNRSFMLPSLLLAPGANTLTVQVTDKVGNTSKTTATVNYMPPTRQLSLNAFSGNGQTGPVHALLSSPLVVQLLSSDGTPVAGRPVTFTVTRSDGMVEVLPHIAQSVYVVTDVSGKASALFQLGSRNGLGINQVTASTPGAAGTVLFVATSTAGPAAQIHAIHGENQRGLLGEPLPEALQVYVQDAYNNPVPGATVTYTVTAGDGTLNNATAVTDGNGRAQASLTLGQQEGAGNYLVTAQIPNSTNQPVTFAASGYAAGPVSNTSVSGVVLDNANTPIPGATARLLGTTLSATSDTNGHFTISGAPVGTVTLSVDGSTSTRTETFPFLSFVLQDLPGQNNTLNKPIYLPTIQADNAQTVGGDDPVTLTMANVPGVAFTIAPHSVTFPDGSTVGKMSLSQVKSDMVPMAPAAGSAPDLIWTLQPAGARFSVPVQITLPNTQGLAPGKVTEFYQYDHDLEQFVSAGTAHVSADGSVIVSDPGFGITKAGWGHDLDDNEPDDCPESCDDHNECTDDHALICGCSNTPRNGACGSDKPGTCQKAGMCVGGYCNGPRLNPGAPCDDGVFCTENDVCQAGTGTCKGTPKPSITGLHTPTPDAITFEAAYEKGVKPLVLFLDKLAIGVKIDPIFNVEFNQSKACCEAKKLDDALKYQIKVTGGLKVATFPIPIPGAAYGVPGVGSVYLYVQAGVAVSANVSRSQDDCDGSVCWSGGGGVQATLELGLRAEAIGFSVSGGGQGGVSAAIQLGCYHGPGQAIFSIGSTDLKGVFSIGAPGGRTYGFEKVVVSAQDLGQASLPLN